MQLEKDYGTGQYLTEEEIARLLKVEKRSIKTERLSGRLPYCRIAGKIRISPEQFAAYQENIKKCPENNFLRDSQKRQPRLPGTFSGTMAPGQDAQAVIQRIRRTRRAS